MEERSSFDEFCFTDIPILLSQTWICVYNIQQTDIYEKAYKLSYFNPQRCIEKLPSSPFLFLSLHQDWASVQQIYRNNEITLYPCQPLLMSESVYKQQYKAHEFVAPTINAPPPYHPNTHRLEGVSQYREAFPGYLPEPLPLAPPALMKAPTPFNAKSSYQQVWLTINRETGREDVCDVSVVVFRLLCSIFSPHLSLSPYFQHQNLTRPYA